MFTSEVAQRSGRGRVESASAWSATLGEEVHYRAYLPAGHEHRRCAAAYLLHGRGGADDGWERLVPRLDELISRGAVPPLVVVAPHAPWSDGGSWYVDSAFTGEPRGRPVETALTHDLVAAVEAAHGTVPDRSHRVVGGWSMGGAGALSHLLRRPDVFSGALALSPAVYHPLPPADSSARDHGAFGRGDERFVHEVYAGANAAGLLASYAASPSPPVRLFLAVGDREWAHPRPEDARHDLDQETATVHNMAKRVAGVSSRLRVLDGGHDWDVWGPALLEGLPWVLEGAS